MRRLATLIALAAALAACVPDKPSPRTMRASGPIYTVRPGDTLSTIAQRYSLMLSTLARANGIPPPYLIRVGQRLAIPPRPRTPAMVSRPVVQPLPPQRSPVIQSYPSPAPAPVVSRPPAYTPSPGQRIAGAPRLVWPADGPVAESFGTGADPSGLSFAVHAGAAVRAAAAGTVIFAGEEPQKYGRLVLVDHGGGWVTAYGHLARLVVSAGETVRSNGRLGFSGERPLHFELRRDNQPVDPLPQLPPRF